MFFVRCIPCDVSYLSLSRCFFFSDTPTTELYTYCHTLSLHDALPTSVGRVLHDPLAAPDLLELQQHQRAERHRDQLRGRFIRSEEHTSELQSLMRISYAVFCLKKKTKNIALKQCIMVPTEMHSTS